MSYRGDYMGAGDYFRGDPGIFGGIAKLAGSALTSFIPGGAVVKGLLAAAGPALKFGKSKGVSPGAQIAAGLGVPTFAMKQMAAHAHSTTAPIGSSPSGTVHGKGPFYTKTVDQLMKGGGGRRHRRINPGNFKALGRAERRVKRFVDKATKLIRWVHPHKLGHAVPRFHHKKRRK